MGEFDGGNFEQALDILEEIGSDDEDYKFALMIKYNCLMNLGCFSDALTIINLLICDNPYALLFWIDKTKCHYFLDDLSNMGSALDNVERIVDICNTDELSDLMKLCTLIKKYEKSLKYCNMILEIDENHFGALLEKSLLSTFIDDKQMMNECGNMLLDQNFDDFATMMVPFVLKVFSKKYDDCLKMVNELKDIDLKNAEKLKNVIYTQMLCDLNIQIFLEKSVELTLDESISLLFKYNYDGIVCGTVRNVNYRIISCNS